MPLCEQLGLDAPAHWDPDKETYELDYPFPCQYDAEEKRWLFDEGPIDWKDAGTGKPSVMKRWRARGPKNEEFVELLQRGHRQVTELLSRESH